MWFEYKIVSMISFIWTLGTQLESYRRFRRWVHAGGRMPLRKGSEVWLSDWLVLFLVSECRSHMTNTLIQPSWCPWFLPSCHVLHQRNCKSNEAFNLNVFCQGFVFAFVSGDFLLVFLSWQQKINEYRHLQIPHNGPTHAVTLSLTRQIPLPMKVRSYPST